MFAKDVDRSELDAIVARTPEGEAVYKDLVEDYANYADVFRRYQTARPPVEHLIKHDLGAEAQELLYCKLSGHAP